MSNFPKSLISVLLHAGTDTVFPSTFTTVSLSERTLSQTDGARPSTYAVSAFADSAAFTSAVFAFNSSAASTSSTVDASAAMSAADAFSATDAPSPSASAFTYVELYAVTTLSSPSSRADFSSTQPSTSEPAWGRWDNASFPSPSSRAMPFFAPRSDAATHSSPIRAHSP